MKRFKLCLFSSMHDPLVAGHGASELYLKITVISFRNKLRTSFNNNNSVKLYNFLSKKIILDIDIR